MSCSSKIEAFAHCYVSMKFDRLVELPQLMLTVPSRYKTICEKATNSSKATVDVEIYDFGSDHSITELLGKQDLGRLQVRRFNLRNGTISTGPTGKSTRIGVILSDLRPEKIEFDQIQSDTSVVKGEFDITATQGELEFKINDCNFVALEESAFVLVDLKRFELRNTNLQMSVDGAVELKWPTCEDGPEVAQVIFDNSISKEQQFPNQLVKISKDSECLGNRTVETSLLKYDSSLSDKLRPFLTFAFKTNSAGLGMQKLIYDSIDCCPLENRWFFSLMESLKSEKINDKFVFSMQCKDIQMRQATSIVGTDAINGECSKPGKTKSFVISIVFIAMAIILLVTTSCVFMFYVLPRSKGDTISLAPNAHLKHSMGGGGPSVGTGENSASTNKYPSIVEIKSTVTAANQAGRSTVRSGIKAKSPGGSSLGSPANRSGNRTGSGSKRVASRTSGASKVASGVAAVANKPTSKLGKQTASVGSGTSRSLAGAGKNTRSSGSTVQKVASKK